MFALVIGRSNFKLKTKKIVTNFEFFMKAINDFGQKNETLTSKKSNFHQVKTNLYRWILKRWKYKIKHDFEFEYHRNMYTWSLWSR